MESWIAPLAANRAEQAWDLLVDRYRRLIFAAIRRYTTDPDDVMDVFARVCEALRDDDFARLRKYAARADERRKFSTWLCAVIHNLAIDWIRHRDGRRRLGAIAGALPPIQRRIFEHVFVQGRSHVETYELLRAGELPALSFADFLKELAATYRGAGAMKRGRLVLELAADLPDSDPSGDDLDPAMLKERSAILQVAMQTLPHDDRAAVQLYIVDGVPAEQVARSLGWQGAKAVYNRVYRALARLREQLQRAGITAGDL